MRFVQVTLLIVKYELNLELQQNDWSSNWCSQIRDLAAIQSQIETKYAQALELLNHLENSKIKKYFWQWSSKASVYKFQVN